MGEYAASMSPGQGGIENSHSIVECGFGRIGSGLMLGGLRRRSLPLASLEEANYIISLLIISMYRQKEAFPPFPPSHIASVGHSYELTKLMYEFGTMGKLHG